jgi:hypothetical protein
VSQLDLKEYAITQVRGAAKRYCDDLEAMSDDALAEKPCGTGRAALDYTYETAFVNRMIADRIGGRTPADWPWNDSWATAPEGYGKTDAIADIRDSSEAIVTELEAAPAEKIGERFEVDGRMTSFVERAIFSMMHMMYHCAQLNYCQSLKGDMEVHWS